MKSTTSIYKFSDYRTFLLAHAQDMKQKKSQWSYGLWARELGLKSTSSITKIIQGDREPGAQIEAELAKYFQFDEKQMNYFRDLVQLQKMSRNPRLSALLMEKIDKDFSDPSLRTLDSKIFATISNWYYLSLRELCRLKSFQEDPKWISEKFLYKVTPTDIKQALNVLIDLGLLTRKTNGQLTLSEGRINTSNDISNEAIKRYHEQMLDLAKTAIRDISVEQREMSSVTLLMSSQKMSLAKEMIREFKQKFERLMEEDSGDQIYQMQIQLFPITKQINLKD